MAAISTVTSAALPQLSTSKSSRNWSFTLFYYVWEDIEALVGLTCRGIIFQEEMCPTSGRPHLQGFVRFDRGVTMMEVKRLFGAERDHVHLEPARNPFALVNYCRKGETRMGECYEEGDLSFEQGKSSELADACDALINGASFRDLVRDYTLQCVRHSRGLQFIKQYADAARMESWRQVTVYVITGPSGVGKTRSVYECFDGIYKLTRPASDGNVWFGSYDGHRTLFIDDFYGWIPYSSLLHILDGYPLELPIKGGFMHAVYDTVVITSNDSPHEWYRGLFSTCSPALARRIHHWIRPSVDRDPFFDHQLISLALRAKPCPYGPPMPREPTAVSENFRDIPARRAARQVGDERLIPLEPHWPGSVTQQQRDAVLLGPPDQPQPSPAPFRRPFVDLTNK